MDLFEEIDHQHPDFGNLYDELPLWSAPFGLRMLEHVRIGPRLTILDVGAGTGFLSLELAQRCGARSTVHAVDPWGAAAQRLRWKLERLALPNVFVHECDAASLPLPDGIVDVVVSNLGIHNFADPAAVLAECVRVARPGAGFHLTTNLSGHMREFYDVFRATLQEAAVPGATEALDAHVSHRGSLESVESLLRSGGLDVHKSRAESFTMRFSGGAALLRHWFIRLGFLPAWRDLVPPESRARVFALLEANLDRVAAGRGELALSIPVAYVEAGKPE